MSFISRLHTDLRRARSTRRNAIKATRIGITDAPKTYPRMRRIELADLENTHGGTFSLGACGALFAQALTADSADKRPYASDGDLYPIETYLVTEMIDNREAVQCFHYDPSAHALELLCEPASFELSTLARRSEPFRALIIFTAAWNRIAPRYGDFGYTLALLETGRMSQNILDAAHRLDLTAAPLDAFDDEAVASLLDIDADDEQAVHAIALY